MDSYPQLAQWNAQPRTRLILAGLCTTILYVLFAELGLQFAVVHHNVTAVWPPSGLALAALLIFGVRLWPAVAAGALLVNVMSGIPLLACCVIATGNTLAAVAGALLLNMFTSRSKPLDTLRGTLVLLGGGALLASMISASVGALTLFGTGLADKGNLASIWFTWWLGDCVGIMLVTPLLLAWQSLPQMKWPNVRITEAVVLLLYTLLIAQLVFGRNSALATSYAPIGFLALTPLCWAAVRFGKHGATACLVLVATSAVWGTIGSSGPFANAGVNNSLLLLQAFMGVATLTTLLLMASVRERQQTRKLLERHHEEQANSLGEILEHSLNEIYMFDANSLNFINVNQCARDNLGYTMEELEQLTPVDIKPEMSHETFCKMLEPLLAGTTGRLRFETSHCRKDGSRYPVEVNLQLTGIGSERVFVAIILDITERHNTLLEMDHMAHHDMLTDLPNRLLFTDRLTHALHHQQRSGRSLALMFMDLDGFKRINDSLGHQTGDRLLQQVAQRLQLHARLYDTIARLGGDEFTIIIEDLDSKDTVPEIAQRLLESLERPFYVSGREVYLSASIGISMYPQDGEDVTSLMKYADIAMFQAKKDGGKNFQFYLADTCNDADERLALEADLRNALEQDAFHLHFQPKVSLESDKIVGVEALLRWNHPQHGMLPPNMFIPVAEEAGLIETMGEWVMRAACRQAVAWKNSTGACVPVAVNLSGLQINQRLVATVSDVLETTGLEPGSLELEVTESCIMDQASTTIEYLCELRKLGVHLAIDDFGTGYSSMTYLKRLPIDTLKIDRSFVNDVPSDCNDVAIIQAILALGHSLNLLIVAEGVETEEQRAFLCEQGCDVMQGYLFSRPLPAEEIEQLLLDNKPDLVLVK